MPLDPEVREFLDALSSADQYPATGDPSDVRTRVAGAPIPALEGIWRIEELTIPSVVPVRARLYTPDDSASAIVIALHGGGWVLGDLLFTESQCRQLANRVGCRVLSIDYRLAPEHPFPAALDDVYATLTHVAEAAADLGVDRSRIANYGQSAGANLAAAAALRARDLRGPELCLQVLVYPVVDADFTRPSCVEWGDGPGLTRAQMQWYWDCYAPEAARNDPYVSPLHAATLAGLPPALVVTAGGDPLQSEGQAYAECLEADGVNVVHSLYDGMHHGFMNLAQVFPKAQLAFDEVVRELRRAFAM